MTKSINFINNKITENMVSLDMICLDLGIEIEDIKSFKVLEVEKQPVKYDRNDYKVLLNIQTDTMNFDIENHFSYNPITKEFEDSEKFAEL
jgi:hypothetical protein